MQHPILCTKPPWPAKPLSARGGEWPASKLQARGFHPRMAYAQGQVLAVVGYWLALPLPPGTVSRHIAHKPYKWVSTRRPNASAWKELHKPDLHAKHRQVLAHTTTCGLSSASATALNAGLDHPLWYEYGHHTRPCTIVIVAAIQHQL